MASASPAWAAPMVPFFQALDFGATAISADGSVVVGSRNHRAYRWTEAGGTVELGVLDGGSHNRTWANGVSGDGSVVVGSSGGQAFRWTADDGMVALSPLVGASGGEARDVSADGSLIFGQSGNEAVRWMADGQVESLGIDTGEYYNRANAVSADGSVVAVASSPLAFRWTAETGIVALEREWRSDTGTIAMGISADGSVVVGASGDQRYYKPVRWTLDEEGEPTVEFLGHTSWSGVSWGIAYAASADGSVVVGRDGSRSSGYQAFYWTEEKGIMRLYDMLVDEFDLGAQLDGWFLSTALAISDDGMIFAGSGIDPDGVSRGWVAGIRPASAIYWLNDTNIDNEWSTGANWSSGSVPTSNQNVRFDIDSTYSVVFTDDVEVQDVSVTSGEVTFESKMAAHTLTAAGAAEIYDAALILSYGNLAASTITVGAGGTLSGTGTIIGNTTVEEGGRLAPGNSTGTLTFQGYLDIQDIGEEGLEFELGDRSTGDYDQVVVEGDLFIDGLAWSHFEFIALEGVSPGTYTLFTVDGGDIVGDLHPTDTYGLIANYPSYLLQLENALQLVVTPEPSGVMPLLGMTLIGFLWSWRRR